MELASKETKGILILHRSGVKIKTSQKNKDHPPVLLLLSGFPDTADTWDRFAAPFESKYHVVKMAYPGMEVPITKWWGYSFPEVQDALLNVVQGYRDMGCENVYLVGHDWGAIASIMYANRYPSTVTKLVLEDVGVVSLSEVTFSEAMVTLIYQWFLTFLFLLSRFIPGTRWFHFLVNHFPWETLGPDPSLRVQKNLTKVQPWQCHPYWQLVMFVLRARNLSVLRFPKDVAILFVYGKHKNCCFHGQRFLNKLDQIATCRQVGYDTGHWVHETEHERFAADVQAFLES